MPQPKTWTQHGRPEVTGADVPAATQTADAVIIEEADVAAGGRMFAQQ